MVWGFGGKAPIRQRHGGQGAEPPTLEILRFFAKITKFWGYFDKKIMLLKHSLEIGSANMIKLIA